MISLIQHFEADFPQKVSLKILNSGIILKTFTHVFIVCSFTHKLTNLLLHVILQVISPQEASPAKFTLKWPLSGVSQHVPLQVRTVVESVAAKLAFVRFLSSMRIAVFPHGR